VRTEGPAATQGPRRDRREHGEVLTVAEAARGALHRDEVEPGDRELDSVEFDHERAAAHVVVESRTGHHVEDVQERA